MKRSLICISLCVSLLYAGAAAAKHHEDKFRMMDTDGDGRVTAAEHAAAAQKMFMEADANRDGAVTMQEMDAMKDRKHDMKHDMKHGDRMDGDQMRRQDGDDDGN